MILKNKFQFLNKYVFMSHMAIDLSVFAKNSYKNAPTIENKEI